MSKRAEDILANFNISPNLYEKQNGPDTLFRSDLCWVERKLLQSISRWHRVFHRGASVERPDENEVPARLQVRDSTFIEETEKVLDVLLYCHPELKQVEGVIMHDEGGIGDRRRVVDIGFDF